MIKHRDTSIRAYALGSISLNESDFSGKLTECRKEHFRNLGQPAKVARTRIDRRPLLDLLQHRLRARDRDRRDFVFV